MMKHLIQTEVVVVGGGPVGLTAAMLLEKFKIGYVVLEKNKSLPHWINIRTKEIFAQIPKLNERIEEHQEPWQHFSHYRYVQRILGRELGSQNNFLPSLEAKLEYCKTLSPYPPSHVSQDKLIQIILESMKQDNIQLNIKVTGVVENESDQVVLNAVKNQKEKVRVEAKYVIACDGYNSTLRNALGISMEGEPKILHFVNVHFTSKKLAEMITQGGQDAMLHFVYNKDFPAVLVNHSKKDGVFVLQVPNYLPFFDISTLYSPEQLIKLTLDPKLSQSLNDLQIIHSGKWSLNSQIASNFSKGDIFLAGDSAHCIPPAGGFGMNVGIQDVHNLIHKLNTLKVNTEMASRKETELLRYGQERKEIDRKYLELGRAGYQTSLDIARELGFNPQYLSIANAFSFLPFKKNIFTYMTKTLFKPRPVTKRIKMFENEQFQIERLSKHRFQMIKDTLQNPNICYYLDKNAKREDYQELLGVQDDAIKIVEMGDEKLVRSDGIVIH